MKPFLLACLILSVGALPLSAEPGIQGKKAPRWAATDWIQLPKGKNALEPHDYKGKVIYLYNFQSWCPGCHAHGFPTLKSVSEHYKDDPKVAFVAIQTVFEGFAYNDVDELVPTAEKFGLDIPFGQSGKKGQPSDLMRRYRSGGTPWTVIIDQKGVVRYNAFHIEAEQAVKLIDSLLK